MVDFDTAGDVLALVLSAILLLSVNPQVPLLTDEAIEDEVTFDCLAFTSGWALCRDATVGCLTVACEETSDEALVMLEDLVPRDRRSESMRAIRR